MYSNQSSPLKLFCGAGVNANAAVTAKINASAGSTTENFFIMEMFKMKTTAVFSSRFQALFNLPLLLWPQQQRLCAQYVYDKAVSIIKYRYTIFSTVAKQNRALSIQYYSAYHYYIITLSLFIFTFSNFHIFTLFLLSTSSFDIPCSFVHYSLPSLLCGK